MSMSINEFVEIPVPDLYVEEVQTIEGMVTYKVNVSVIGDTGSGKTFEIMRETQGPGKPIKTKSTDELDLYTKIYSIDCNMPLEGYKKIKIEGIDLKLEELLIISNFGGTKTGVTLTVKDPAGQYNTTPDLTKLFREFLGDLAGEHDTLADLSKKVVMLPTDQEREEKIKEAAKLKQLYDRNLALLRRAHVVEIVIDTTKLDTLDSIIKNWLPMLDEAVIDPNAVFSIYFSKAGISKNINFKNIKDEENGEYVSLHKAFPRLNELLETLEKRYKTYTFIGEMDAKIGEKTHQAEVYLLRTNKYLAEPVKFDIDAAKQVPAIKYLYDQGKITEGTNELIKYIESELAEDYETPMPIFSY